MGLGDLLDRSRSALAEVRDGIVELAHTDNPESFIGSLLGLEGDAVEGVHFDVVQFAPDVEDFMSDAGIHAHSRLGGIARMGLEKMGLGSGWDFDVRKMLFWLGVLAVLMLVAVMTNPTEASFRTYLTELSFRRHLAVIRSNDDHPSDASLSPLPITSLPSTSGSTGHPNVTTDDKTDSKTHTCPSSTHTPGTETPTIAPFRFSNHVAISLRTPMLYFRSAFFVSVAITSPVGPPAFLSDPMPHALLSNFHGKKSPVPRERHVLYLGYLGYWVQVGVIPRKLEWAWRVAIEGPKEKGRKRSVADRSGVLELKAIPGKDDSATATSTKAVSLHPSKSNKSIRKVGSTNDLHESSTLPLHSLPSIPIPVQPESRRPSLVNLNLLPPPSTATEPADTPTLVALKHDLSKAQDTLLDLKNQLLSHEQTVSDAHASLQSTLDELRNKRKEDDVERQELKGRTKTFEEQKRQAESARKEAEKRLKAAEAGRDGLIAKIEGAKKEMGDIRSAIRSSELAVEGLKEDREKMLVSAREAVEGRKVELERLEEEMIRVEREQEALGGKVREAEERLRASQEAVEAAKKIGPEEEMMMMAAAYEAAAQEGYMYGQAPGSGPGATPGQQGQGHGQAHGTHTPAPHPGGHNTHSANWASQAAAYMAEAGMPLLDQSYTARSTPAHPSRTSADPKRLADLTGFEDFGPGHSLNGNGTGDGFGQMLGAAANRLHNPYHPSTPPLADYPPSETDSDIYGHDPGSPNGGISTSFSANLLPQGLFRSLLGGDMTPVEDGSGSTLSEALNFEPPPILLPDSSDSPLSHIPYVHDSAYQSGPEQTRAEDEGGHHSGSESGDEAEEVWKSPMLEFNPPTTASTAITDYPSAPAVQQTTPANRMKRFSFSRLLPPNTTPPSASSATPPVLSGLPPVSRRWFSGTNSASAENLHAYPLFQGNNGSSDSLGNHPSSLGLGGDSPFAPSETEKKQLALKWGPLSKYRWGSPAGGNGGGGSNGEGGSGGLGRSASMDLTNGSNPHSRVASAPEVPSPGQSWMARHLLVNANAHPSTPSATSSAPTKSKSPLIPLPSPNRDSTDLMADDELDYHSLIPTPMSNLGSSADSKEDKKGFKFFSLRKSQGGGVNAGTSPGSQ